jgi:predicted ATPase/DNA-binding CsgD family transcriptional regulator
MARLTPAVQGETLTWYVDTHEHQLAVGTPAWYSWLQEASLFAFVGESGSFTARKETKPHGATYWKAYRKRGGRLYHAYLGKSEQLTLERLNAIAVQLARRGEGEQTLSAQGFAQETLPESTPHDMTIVTRPASHLPMPLTTIIGREQERATVCDMLRRPEVRLLTLVGTGGIGKTRLGLAVANDLLADYADGVYFVNLAPLRDPALVIPTIAQTLNVNETARRPLLDLLKAFLREKHLLLVLDNFEQVTSAAVQVAELLTSCLHLKALVTSRAVLRVGGEQAFAVPPLAVPDPTCLPETETLAHYESVTLFLQRAQALKPDFELTRANARAVAEVCVRLEGLPLAIELAAARINLLPPQALLARLGQRLAVLTSGAQDAPTRQQTLRNTIEWSYRLLAADEQRLFRRLSVFVGGCTLEAIEAVCSACDGEAGMILDGVTSLLDKSLLQQVEWKEIPRLVMLETIREYGLECLIANGEAEDTLQAHASYYLALAEEAESKLEGPQPALWWGRLEQEYGNLRAALLWSVEQAETGKDARCRKMALRLGGALRLFFWRTGIHTSEGRIFLERALAGSEGVGASVRTKALIAAALMALDQGNYDRGEELCEESLMLCRELGDKASMAYSLFLMGVVAWDRGNLAAARSLLEESLALYEEIGDRQGVAYDLYELAYVVNTQGEYARAQALCEKSVAILRGIGNTWGLASSLLQFAQVLLESLGDPATIRSLLDEGLALYRELGDKEGIAWGNSIVGRLALSQGDVATAHRLLEESMTLYRELGGWKNIAWLLSFLARVEAHQGDHAAAHALYEQSLALCQELGYHLWIATCLEGLAGVVAAQGEPAWAARLWGAAEALRETIGAPIPRVYRPTYEHSVTVARAQFGEKPFAAAWAQGRAMTLEQVLAAQAPVTIPTLVPAEPAMAPPVPNAPTYPDGLTAREVEVLRLVAQGLTDPQVAEQLVISPHTVNSHLKAIYGKLGVSSRSAATRYAIEHHLL